MPQILQDVAEDLIPRAVDDVLRERGVEPVDTPSVKDVSIDEHQPLKFTAAIATAPPVDPGPARRDPAAQAAGQRAGRGSDVDDRAPALGSGALRAGRGTRRPARRDGRRRHDAAQARQGRRGSGGAGGAPGCQHRDRGGGQPAGVRRGSDGPRGRGRQDVHHRLPRRIPGRIAGRGQRAVRADRDRGEVEGAARPRRRVRQGSGLRLAGRAAGVREGAADARGGAEPGPRACARIS